MIEAHGWHVNSLTFSDDGELLVSASNTERTAKIHDVSTGRLLVTLRGHQARILSLAFVPRTELVATAGAAGTVRLWDVHSGQEQACLNLDANALLVSAVACSRDGRMLAATDGGERLLVWDRLDVLTSHAPRR
jgi:WD40 repeat protein